MKTGEIDYPKAIGASGRRHAKYKPFSDPDCGRHLVEIGQVICLLPDTPARILDFGCGSGWTSIFLANHGYDVLGVDIAPGMIELAEERCREENVSGARFEVGDFENLNPGGDFDGVLFYDSLHHAEDERAALKVAFEALKPGGVCVVCEPGEGHEVNCYSREAVERYNVNEKDMPPRLVRRIGRSLGFTAADIHPHPFDMLLAISATGRGVPAAKLRSRLRRFPVLRVLVLNYFAWWRKYSNGIVVLVK